MDALMEQSTTIQKSELRYAGFWVRVLATFLDGIVISALVSFIMLAFGRRYGIFNVQLSSSPTNLFSSSAESMSTTIIQWAYSILMLKYYGATLGKMALRLKVVGDGKELDWISIILRETIGKFISGLIIGIGYLMVAWDPRKQGLHDKIANTLVVREN